MPHLDSDLYPFIVVLDVVERLLVLDHPLLSREYRFPIRILVHGGARGADRMAAAIWTQWRRPVETHLADWPRHGYIRNQHMVNLGANICLAFIRNHSDGATYCAL